MFQAVLCKSVQGVAQFYYDRLGWSSDVLGLQLCSVKKMVKYPSVLVYSVVLGPGS